MNLNQHPFGCLAALVLLGVGVGVQAEDADKPEWSFDILQLQGDSWCSITPYPQQNEGEGSINPPLQQVEMEESIDLPTQRSKEGWWLGPTSGIIWGSAREIVFDNSGVQNENEYLSELIWELRHVPVFGIESRWRGKRSNDLEMKFSFAIPNMPVGNMNDYDWFYTDRDWSHWSQSHVKQRWGFIFDFSYEEVIVNLGHFKLKLGAGYHMDWWAWKDEVAGSLYSTFANRAGRDIPDKFTRAKGDRFRDKADALSVGVNGINYWAMYHVPLLTLSGGFEWDIIALSALGRVGPVLGIAKDHHLRRYEFGSNGVYFYDLVFGGPWVDTSLEVEFRITDRFLLSFRGEFAWLRETRGYSVVVPTGDKAITIGRKAGGFAFRRIGVNAFAFWKIGN